MPTGGAVFHAPTQSVRAVHGVPGGAFVGEALLVHVDFASVSPGGSTAVVVRGGQAAVVTGLAGREPSELSPEGLISQVDQVAWSAAGDVMALYSSAGRQIQQVRLSGGEARVGTPVDLSGLEGKITALAVDSSGERTAAGVEHPTAGGIYLIRDGVTSGPLVSMKTPVGAVYGADGALYVAERFARQSLVLVDDVPSRSLPLVEPGQEAIEVAGQALSSDRRRLYVAARTGLYVYDLSANHLQSATRLVTPPETLTVLRESLLLLNSARSKIEPLWVMTEQETPVVHFIPVLGEDPDSL